MNFAALLLLASFQIGAEVKPTPFVDRLPEDGAWSKYGVNIDTEGRNVSLTFTIRSVGEVMHQGKPCRCLEIEQVCKEGQQQILVYTIGDVVWRLIIPEEAFGEGKDPLSQAVKVWRQIKPGDPAPENSIAAADPLLAALLKGPEGKLKLEAGREKIAWQRGTLECQVLSGDQQLEFAGATVRISSKIFKHEDVPFSIAGTEKEIKASAGGVDYRVSIKAAVQDFGKDAKPTLPELVP